MATSRDASLRGGHSMSLKIDWLSGKVTTTCTSIPSSVNRLIIDGWEGQAPRRKFKFLLNHIASQYPNIDQVDLNCSIPLEAFYHIIAGSFSNLDKVWVSGDLVIGRTGNDRPSADIPKRNTGISVQISTVFHCWKVTKWILPALTGTENALHLETSGFRNETQDSLLAMYNQILASNKVKQLTLSIFSRPRELNVRNDLPPLFNALTTVTPNHHNLKVLSIQPRTCDQTIVTSITQFLDHPNHGRLEKLGLFFWRFQDSSGQNLSRNDPVHVTLVRSMMMEIVDHAIHRNHNLLDFELDSNIMSGIFDGTFAQLMVDALEHNMRLVNCNLGGCTLDQKQRLLVDMYTTLNRDGHRAALELEDPGNRVRRVAALSDALINQNINCIYHLLRAKPELCSTADDGPITNLNAKEASPDDLEEEWDSASC